MTDEDKLIHENIELKKRLQKRQKTNEFWKALIMIQILGWPGLTMLAIIGADFFLKLRSPSTVGVDATIATSVVQGMSSVLLAGVTGILSYLGGTAHGREQERQKHEQDIIDTEED